MISALSFFFGITLAYTGFLVLGRDLTVGIILGCAGLILIINPALRALRYCRTHFGSGQPQRGPRFSRKIKPKKVYLKIVKSEDDKPTIH